MESSRDPMSYELSDAQLNSLARDLDGLYRETQKKMGQEDLDYVRNVKRYSQAIKRRSFELFNHPDTPFKKRSSYAGYMS